MDGPGRLRKIIHVDMDAFYASVEQRDAPELRGQPVAVGGSRERGVVAAASYEAREFGVRSAMPSVTAKRKCPGLIFVKPRFDVYRSVSHQIRAIFARYTPLIEPLSLDEAYLDVTENLKARPSATEIAEEIREKIRVETGLTASAGVSYNKFLAKVASDERKPDGLFVITPKMGPAFVEALPVGKFHGVGPVTRAKMEGLGISNGGDLRDRTLPFLVEHFGKAGPYYFSLARGVDDRPVCPDRVRKSFGAEATFHADIFTAEEARDALGPLDRQGVVPLRELDDPGPDGDSQGWGREAEDQEDRSASPRDKASRRPSHSDERRARRRELLGEGIRATRRPGATEAEIQATDERLLGPAA